MNEIDYTEEQISFPWEDTDVLFEHAPSGDIIFLDDGRITRINKTLLNWLGYNKEDVVNVKRIQDFLKIGGQVFFETHMFPHLKLQGFIKEINLDLVRKDGQTFPGLLNIVRVKGAKNDPVVFRSSILDISERKEYEKELIEAMTKAENLSHEKAEFLAMMSHEIRTPLSSIMGVINLIQKTDLSPVQEEYAHVLLRTSENLLNLVNNLLDLSKIEADKVKLEQKAFLLSDLIDILSNTFELKCQVKNVDLEIELDPNVPNGLIGDPVKLNQIFMNLIGNAIKFTSKGFIKVHISVLSKDNDIVKLRCQVTDTGIGIAREKLKTIFQKFSQASYDVNQEFGGSGLGLTISQKLLKMHKSVIKVKSEEGKGSEFSFDIQFQIDHVQRKKKDMRALEMFSESMNFKKILIVDDSKMNIYILSEFLKAWDITFEAVEDGVQAVEAVKNNQYDLILMDLNMPRMDGYQASSAIRRLNLVKQPIIIALSAMDKDDVVEKLENGGINGFASKPFQPLELAKVLSEHMENMYN